MGSFDILNFSGDKANYDKYQSKYNAGRDMLLKAIYGANADYGKSEHLLQGLMPLINKGYGAARADLGRAGGAARTSIQNNQAQGLGAIGTGLAQKGLGSTTILQNAQRGVYSDTSQRLAQVDEDIGQMLSGLRVGQTQAQLGAQGALANFYPQKAAAGYDMRSGLANYLTQNFAQRPGFGSYLGSQLNSNAQLATFGLAGGFSQPGGIFGPAASAGGGGGSGAGYDTSWLSSFFK